MEKKTERKKKAFCAVNYIVLALSLVAAVYIMANRLGLVDTLDFGAGAYYYADIPEFARYTDGAWYTSPVPMWVLTILFLLWGALMYKLWCRIEGKDSRKGQDSSSQVPDAKS